MMKIPFDQIVCCWSFFHQRCVLLLKNCLLWFGLNALIILPWKVIWISGWITLKKFPSRPWKSTSIYLKCPSLEPTSLLVPPSVLLWLIRPLDLFQRKITRLDLANLILPCPSLRRSLSRWKVFLPKKKLREGILAWRLFKLAMIRPSSKLHCWNSFCWIIL